SLGHTRGQLAVCDLAGTVLAQTALDVAAEGGPGPGLLPRLLDAWEALLAEHGTDRACVRGVGVGMPTLPTVPEWDGAAIAGVVADRFPVPVCLDNDVNVMALGEHRSRSRHGIDDLLFVKLSTGIGAGLIAGGRIQRGALGAAGEIGHIA